MIHNSIGKNPAKAGRSVLSLRTVVPLKLLAGEDSMIVSRQLVDPPAELCLHTSCMVTICTAQVVNEHEGTTTRPLQDPAVVMHHNRRWLKPVVNFAEHIDCQLCIMPTKTRKSHAFPTTGSICHSMSCCAVY